MTERPIIVVDGANVAYGERSKGGAPKVNNLIAMREALEQEGYSPIIIIDASLRHAIDDPDKLEALIQQQIVRQAPAGTDADYFVLETAEMYEARVVSNDTYEPYREAHPWIYERRVPFMVIKDEVILYERDAAA